jgi:hypothetical protein
MANRPSRLAVGIPTASYDGRYWGRYPRGDRPGGGGWAANAYARANAAAAFGGSLHQGSYADLDLEAYPEGYEIMYSYNDHQSFDGFGGVAATQFASGGRFNNCAFYRIPLADVDQEATGLAVYTIANGGTFGVRRLNVGFTPKFSAGFCTGAAGAGTKWMIVNTSDTPSGVNGTGDRPMIFLSGATVSDNPAYNDPDLICVALAQGTTQRWEWSKAVGEAASYYYYNGDVPFYLGEADGTFNGKPVYGPTNTPHFEYRMEMVSSAEFPNGLLALRAYARDGTIYQSQAPWNFDAGALVDVSYVTDIQMFGAGEYNIAPPTAGLTAELHESTRLRANFQGWMGAPEGFLL